MGLIKCPKCGGELRFAGFVCDTILFYCPKCEESHFDSELLPVRVIKSLKKSYGRKLYYTLLLDEYIKRNYKPVPASLINWLYRMLVRTKGRYFARLQRELKKLGLIEIIYIKGYKYLKPKVVDK
ncbi:MAG TPA: hypothetical protein ENF41_03430 [Candidatus Bathyarchaeota archaeon]|nr:hypothetical protein [Candidatus Bathyarchaeota archaeon]